MMAAIMQNDAPKVQLPDAARATAMMQLDRAGWAGRYFARFDRDHVMQVAQAVAQAAHDNAARYAEWAVKETGFGVVAHKKQKNELTGFPLLEYYRDLDLVTPRVDADRKMVELPKPAGVVFALTPATNPISTLNYKVMLALLSRNAIVISPHPRAAECSLDAVRVLAQAAENAGAPSGLIQCLENPNVPLIEAVMASPKVAVTLATGGGAMVRAAYSSSNPAIGVGPGNAPVFVDESADATKAARRIVESKSFDNSVLCTNESVVITLKANRNSMEQALRAAGAHLCRPDEVQKLREYLFPGGAFNLDALGQSAVTIAKAAGVRAQASAKVLVAPVEHVAAEEPLCREKLCPVLALASVGDAGAAIRTAQVVLRITGAGHSAAYHGEDEATAMRFAAAMPAYRVVVNAPCSQGAAGFATHLPPSFTIGTGYFGRSSLGENIGPQHLVHWTRMAYNRDQSVTFGGYEGIAPAYQNTPGGMASTKSVGAAPKGGASLMDRVSSRAGGDVDRDMLRQLILEELRSISGNRA